MSGARCSGHCCRRFIVPVIAGLGGLDEFKKLSAPGVDPRYDADEHRYIADMLIDTGVDTDTDPLGGSKVDPPQRVYKCKHFDGTNCTVYEQRPDMCKSYPSYGACNVEGCTRVTVACDESIETQNRTEGPA